MRVSLARVMGFSFLATIALVALLVVIVLLSAAGVSRQPLEWLYVAVSIPLVGASTTFTVAAIALAMRHTRQEAAAGRTPSRPRSAPALRVFGLLALVANAIVIGLSGRVNALNVALAVLVGSLLLLLHEHARRQGIRDRTR